MHVAMLAMAGTSGAVLACPMQLCQPLWSKSSSMLSLCAFILRTILHVDFLHVFLDKIKFICLFFLLFTPWVLCLILGLRAAGDRVFYHHREMGYSQGRSLKGYAF